MIHMAIYTAIKSLKLVANGIGESIRNHDLLVRYGGEEFIVLLSRTNDADAYQTAERIRRHIEKMEYRNERPITVSIGITKKYPERHRS